MNETNENNVNQASVEQVSAPPVNEVPAQPVDNNVAPVLNESANLNAQVPNTEQSNQNVSESQETNVSPSEPDSETVVKDKNEAKLRFPLVVVVIFIVFIVFMFIYYFVLITPKNLFNKALKAQVGGIIDMVSLNGDSEYTSRNYKIKTTVNTKGDNLSQKESVLFLDGLEYNFELGRDIKNGNMSLNILSNVSDFENVDKMQHEENLDSTYYYYNQSIYAKASDTILKTNTHGDNSENTNEIFDLLKEGLYEMIDLIDVNKVDRSIATKSVKNQSLLAIRFNTEFTNDEINKIFQSTIDNLLDNSKHPEFVKKFADNLDITEEQAKETINGLKNYKIKAKDIKLDYYLNLACTGLVAYELNVDDTIISISSFSGYYFIDIDSGDKFDVDLNLNTKTGDFDFKILLDNKKTYTYVLGKSNSILNEKYVPIGNDFVVEFYDETEKNSSKKNEKPYLIVNSHIDFEYNTDIKFFDEKNVIPYEEGSVEDINEIEYTIEKLGYEFVYLLGLNVVNRTEITAPEFAKSIFNIESDVVLPNEDVTLPETDNVVGNPEEVETENPDVEVPEESVVEEDKSVDNSLDIPVVDENSANNSTKSE